MINLKKVQEDLSIICPGWKLLGTQVIEIQYKDFIEKNLMLLATKLNFPQSLMIKVNIETGLISEIYTSAADQQNYKAVPYYSIGVEYNDKPILNKIPSDYYFIDSPTQFDAIFQEKEINDFFIIQRLDIKTNDLNKWYVNLKLEDVKKICSQKTTDFVNSKQPNNIFIYSNKKFEDCNTLLLSYIPTHKLYEEYYKTIL
jgi:hypothetical protein